MIVEYELLLVAGGTWLLNLASMYWIWEDSQKHKKRAWPWLFLLLLGDPFSTLINNLYRYEFLPSQGVYPYLVPFFKYDSARFVELVWVLDTLFFWNLAFSIIDGTVTYVVMFWIYRDCRRIGERATPWIFAMKFIQSIPFPISYFIPIGGYTGQIFIFVCYILHKFGYI